MRQTALDKDVKLRDMQTALDGLEQDRDQMIEKNHLDQAKIELLMEANKD